MSTALTQYDEVLFRQIHPNWIEQNDPTSQAFAPTPKDNAKLSVDRSSLTTADRSYKLFTGAGHASVAVYGVTVGEFSSESVQCFSDPILPAKNSLPNPAHAFADFSGQSINQCKKIAKRLKQKAIARKQLYP